MTKSVTIYIIDDDRDAQDFLIEALKEIDPSIECFIAINGQEGLRKLKVNSIPVPSIIFLDLNMPRINGRQFLIDLKNDLNYRDIPVIIYSTSSHQKDIDETKELGANECLVKAPDYSTWKERLYSILSIILPA